MVQILAEYVGLHSYKMRLNQSSVVIPNDSNGNDQRMDVLLKGLVDDCNNMLCDQGCTLGAIQGGIHTLAYVHGVGTAEFNNSVYRTCDGCAGISSTHQRSAANE